MPPPSRDNSGRSNVQSEATAEQRAAKAHPLGNASSAGTMLDRVTFAVINKGSDDSLTQTFTFTMS